MPCSIIASFLLLGLGNRLWPLPNSSTQGKYDFRKNRTPLSHTGRVFEGGEEGGRVPDRSVRVWGRRSPLKAQQRCSTRTPRTGTEAARCPPDATVAQRYTAPRALRGREGSGAGRIPARSAPGERATRALPPRRAPNVPQPRGAPPLSAPKPGPREAMSVPLGRPRPSPRPSAAFGRSPPSARRYPRGESLLSARAPRPAAFCKHGGRTRGPTRAPARRFCKARRAAPSAALFPSPSPQVRDGPGGGGPASRRPSSRRSPGGAAAAGARRSAPRAVGAPRGRPVGPRGGGAGGGGGGGAEATSGRPRGARAGDGGGGTGVEAAALRRRKRRRRRRRRRDAGGGRGAAVVELLRAGGGGRRPEGCRGAGRWVRGRAGREVAAGAPAARGERGSERRGSREEVAGRRDVGIWRRSGERRRAEPAAGRLSGLYVTALGPGAAERLSPSRAARRTSPPVSARHPRRRRAKSRSAPRSPRDPFPAAPSGAAPAGGALRASAASFSIALRVLPLLPAFSFPSAFPSRGRSVPPKAKR